MVLRWFAENTKGFKKIVRLDILSSVISLFVSVKNLNYVLSCKTNEDFLCNGAWVLPQIKKRTNMSSLYFNIRYIIAPARNIFNPIVQKISFLVDVSSFFSSVISSFCASTFSAVSIIFFLNSSFA